MAQKSAVDMDMGAPYSCPGMWKTDGNEIPNSMPPPRNISVAQRIAETFARQYYGLLADRPAAIANFYTDESLLTRNYAAQQPLPMPNQGMTSIGRQQIMETVMSSVGRCDTEPGKPCVYTNINSVNAAELLDRDVAKKSGVMAQITGTMYFVQDGTQWRFSRSVFLEPCMRTGEALYVRNDIVHYTDFMRLPGVEMQTGMQPPLYPQAPMPVCAQARHPMQCAMPAAAPLELPGGMMPRPLDLPGAPSTVLPPSSVISGLNLPPSDLMSPAPTEVTPGLSVVTSPSTMPSTTPAMSAVVTTAFPSPSTVANDAPPPYSTEISDTSNLVLAPSSPDSKSPSPTQDVKSPTGAPSSPQNVSQSNGGSSQESTPPPTNGATSAIAGAQSSSPSNQAETTTNASSKENASPPTMSWAAMAANASSKGGAKGTSAKRAPAPQKWTGATGNTSSPSSSDPPPTVPASSIANTPSNVDNEEAAPTGAVISSPTSTQAKTMAGSSTKAQEVAPEKESANHVQLWISGLQTEDPTRSSTKFVPVDAQEVRDMLNKVLKDHASHVIGEIGEIYRKDERKQHALVMCDDSIAKELVHLGKKGKVTLRGERLFLDLGSYKGGGKWHEDRERKGKGKGKGKKG